MEELFLAGQLVTAESHEVMVSTSVEKAVSVMVDDAAKAEAANKKTVENCIVKKGVTKVGLRCAERKRRERVIPNNKLWGEYLSYISFFFRSKSVHQKKNTKRVLAAPPWQPSTNGKTSTKPRVCGPQFTHKLQSEIYTPPV